MKRFRAAWEGPEEPRARTQGHPEEYVDAAGTPQYLFSQWNPEQAPTLSFTNPSNASTGNLETWLICTHRREKIATLSKFLTSNYTFCIRVNPRESVFSNLTCLNYKFLKNVFLFGIFSAMNIFKGFSDATRASFYRLSTSKKTETTPEQITTSKGNSIEATVIRPLPFLFSSLFWR